MLAMEQVLCRSECWYFFEFVGNVTILRNISKFTIDINTNFDSRYFKANKELFFPCALELEGINFNGML